MIEAAKLALEFFCIFLVLYIILYFFSYKKIKKYSRTKAPMNVKYIEFKYKLDIVKLGYKRVSKLLNLCDSFIVSFLFVVTDFIDNVYIRLLVAFILVFPLFAGVYHLVAMYLIKESEK